MRSLLAAGALTALLGCGGTTTEPDAGRAGRQEPFDSGPGGGSAPCDAGAECLSGLCFPYGAGQRCTWTCTPTTAAERCPYPFLGECNPLGVCRLP